MDKANKANVVCSGTPHDAHGTLGTPCEPFNTLLDALEALVDQHSLVDVLEALSEIADYKSDHLAINWQDIDSACWWYNMARQLEALRERGLK